MASGQPVTPRGVNTEGLKRRNFSSEEINNIKNAYRILYRSELTLAQAISELEKLVENQPELLIFLESLKQSDRGIIR